MRVEYIQWHVGEESIPLEGAIFDEDKVKGVEWWMEKFKDRQVMGIVGNKLRLWGHVQSVEWDSENAEYSATVLSVPYLNKRIHKMMQKTFTYPARLLRIDVDALPSAQIV